MKKIINVIIALFIATIILSLFCLIYDYTGPYVKNETEATEYHFASNQYISNMTEGNAWLIMDENGFNNSYKIKKDNIDILLMGSSHMEALQVSTNQNTSYLLNLKIPNLYTYNIGISGRNIYLNVNKYVEAISYYKPKYTAIETSKINLTIEEMTSVINHTLKKQQKYDSSIAYYLKKIPIIKTGFNQLKNWIDCDTTSESNKNISDIDNINYREILTEFLSIISNNAKDNNIIPIIFYHPPENLTVDGTIDYGTDERYLNLFSEVCQELDITFIDVTPYFDELYKDKYHLGHGFNNTKVGSGHLNKYGHEACSQALIDKIIKLESGSNVIY